MYTTDLTTIATSMYTHIVIYIEVEENRGKTDQRDDMTNEESNEQTNERRRIPVELCNEKSIIIMSPAAWPMLCTKGQNSFQYSSCW